jgi:isopenicillin-N epimerase
MVSNPSPFDQAADTLGRNALRHFALDPEIVFLNHGSFGACPLEVLDYQHRLRQQMERQPVQFYVRELESLLDEARGVLAEFVGSDNRDLVFVRNATSAVNAVVRSMALSPGDELLTTDHEYNACRNVLHYVAERSGAQVVTATIGFPVASPDAVVETILKRVNERTRLLLMDHVTSQTGLVLPIKPLVEEMNKRGIDTLIDGAHAPGMVPLDLKRLGASYYTGNCHKWLCAPKGAGFLHVRRDKHPEVRPLAISHGANSPRTDRPRLLIEFDWTGTDDPTPWLCVPRSIRFMEDLVPGGWEALMRHNHELTLAARSLLCASMRIPLPAPDSMIGSIASLPLPDGSAEPSTSPLYADALQDVLLEESKIEVPVVPWPAPPKRLLRISAQAYNELNDYERLAEGLKRAGITAASRNH